jgi:hypothetical protein
LPTTEPQSPIIISSHVRHRAIPAVPDEVTTFYAVSVLSAVRALDDNTFRYEMKAGELAMDVFRRNPKHPGAPHYVIHAFDDPIHAPLAFDGREGACGDCVGGLARRPRCCGGYPLREATTQAAPFG